MKKEYNHKNYILDEFKAYSNIILGIFLIFLLFFVLNPSPAVPRTTSCGSVGTLQNGGFETPTITGTNSIRDDSSVNADLDGVKWVTTATDHKLEIWRNPTPTGISAAEGSQLAELNANQFAGLYQDISTVPGQRILWSLQHRGRSSTESMRVLIGSTSGTTVYSPQSGSLTLNGTLNIQNARKSGTTTDTSNIEDGTAAWSSWSGNYLVPSDQTTTRFLFISFNPSTGGSGNLLDDVVFTPFLACPLTVEMTFGNTNSLNVITQSGVSFGVGHSLSSVTSSNNPNGSSGTVSTSGNIISFTPLTAGNNQTVDYTISTSSLGTTYTDEARITYNVSATVPGSPTSLNATASGSQVALNWTSPSNNGGVAVSDYLVEYQEGSGAWQTFSDGVSTSTSATITGLTGSSNYNFRVSAKNDGSGYSGPGTTGTGNSSSVLSVSAWQCSNLNAFNGISGLLLWLRADCVNGTPTQPSDGTLISQWEDLSGNNFDATSPADSNRPSFESDAGNLINNQPVIKFSRTNSTTGKRLIVNGVDIRACKYPDISIFVVYKTRIGSFGNADLLGLWGNDNGNWDRFYLAKFNWTAADNQTPDVNDVNDGLISLGPSTNPPYAVVEDGAEEATTKLLTSIYDGTLSNASGTCSTVGLTNSGSNNGSKIYFGSTLVTSFADTTDARDAQTKLHIGWDGDNNPFNGDIAEFIVFDRALSSDLPTINEYLNNRYSLDLDISTNLPDVILVDPRATSINFPPLTLSTSTNAMICFSQVADSTGGAISGSPTFSVSRTSTTPGVTENTTTNLWRYSGIRTDVQTQIGSIQVSGTLGNPIVPTGSKWLEVHATSRTSGASDCTSNIQVRKRIELRALNLDTTQLLTVEVN